MNKRTTAHGLGRGLGALLTDMDEESLSPLAPRSTTGEGNAVREISLNDIDINPDQPRRDFDEESLKELAESISGVGVIQPIVVKQNGSRYSIIVGERRFRASRMAGKTTIPAIVRDIDEMTRLKQALIENLQREDLNPVETALGIKALMEKCELTQDEAAKVVGKSRSAVTNTLRLLTLDQQVLAKLRAGEISAGHARALVTVSPERQRRLCELTIQQGWSVRQLERICALPEAGQKRESGKKEKPPELGKLEKMAREAFGTRARIDGDENKGRLIISYSSQEDLENIWSLLEALNQGEL
ncbi:MAG: ParB/RepB/Spo0J family partition protein [Clostridia bacterium]|nr:ParB/RepB/Spo0J family partition protein [Clostridia bacterium]